MSKLKFKMIAVAAALASMAGGAQAAIESGFTQSGTLVLTVFNPSTNAWYLRDLGFTLDTFLPTLQTPTAGLALNSTTNANFGDASGWTAWLGAQSLSALRWNITAVDSQFNLPSDQARLIASSTNVNETAAPGIITNFVGEGNAGGSEGFSLLAEGGTPDVSFYNSGVTPFTPEFFTNGYGLGADSLASIGQSVSLFYFATNGTTVTGGRYGNSATNFASVSLDGSGNFSYTLGEAAPAAVPLPAAAWMMGAGLMGLGGVIRRRKQATLA